MNATFLPRGYLTVEEVAERLDLSRSTVRQYARHPLCRLQAIRVLGRLLFTDAEIRRFERERQPPGRKKSES